MADDFSQFPEVGAGTRNRDSGDFAEFPEVGASQGGAQQYAPMRQQAGAAVEAGARSALETSGFMAGAALGAGGGGLVAGPPGALVGGLVGGVGGFLAGEMAAEGGFGLRSPEQMDPSVRPGAYAGQSLGGSISVGSAPFALAGTGIRFGDSMVGRFLNQMVDTVKRRPKTVALAEGSAAISAAGGAGIAEVVDAGDATTRVLSETAAGILNPTRLALSSVDFAKGLTTKALMSFSPAARETAAAKVLSDIMAITGEDPRVVARILADPNVFPQGELTAAQKSGSAALGALSEYLARSNAQYGAESAEKATAAMDVLRQQITLLTGTGDPAALSAAAQLRGVYYRTLIQTRVQGAQADALTKAGRIARDTPAAREQLSIRAREALEKSIADARTAESAMWSRVDNERPVQTNNLQNTYNEIVADLLPEVRNEKTPAVVRKFLERVTAARDPEFNYDPETFIIAPSDTSVRGTNANEMKQLRSELLDMARQSDRAGEYGQARIYNQLAEAVLDDMDVAFKQAGDTTYDEARTFTRELNDVFSRTFAGKAMAQGRYGDRVAPELLLRKALATGKEAGALQMQELEEATRFMVQRGLGDETSTQVMLDAQERIFRLAAADSVDPTTGRAKPERIAAFLRDNATLLNRFPEVRNDLLAASRSEVRLRTLENRAKNVEDIIAKQASFGSVMGLYSVNPAESAAAARKASLRAISSPDQESEIVRLVNIAKGGGAGRGGRTPTQVTESMEGLRASLFNTILDRSMRGNVLDVEAARQLMFTPSSVGKKPPIQVMQEQGLIKPAEVANIRKLFDVAAGIQRSQRPGTAVQVEQDATDMTVATLSRMLGSGIAGGAARAAGSQTPSLIVHGAGARLAEQVMTKLPMTSVNKVLTEAMTDPEKMALLLNKAKTPEEAAFQARQIHAWLVQSGLTGAQEAFTPTYEQPAQPPTLFTQP